MRILLDECCPSPLRKALPGHDVSTVEMAGLKGIENGDLLRAAEERFEILITADKNLRYQQNLANRRVAIIELPFNSWRRLKPLIPLLSSALSRIQAGQYIEIPPLID